MRRLRATLVTYLDRQLELDARSLAVARLAIGLLLLYDTATRATDLVAHYTDAGAAPRAAFSLLDWSFVWSLHGWSGSAGWEALLFALTGLAALAFTVGAFTRAATAASFVLVLSVQARNPLLHDGQDDLLRLLLLWSLWLPLGRRGSIDAWRAARRGKVESDRLSGLWAIGLAGQLLIIYLSSVIGKWQSGWWRAGLGIERALMLGRYQTEAGRWLAQFHGFLQLSTYGVLCVEGLLPVLLFVPWRRRELRLAALALAFGLHLSFWVFLKLSYFPPLCMATWLIFVPSSFWTSRAPTTPPAPAPEFPTFAFYASLALLVLSAAYVAGTHRDQPLLPDLARRTAEAIGLNQYWVVFAPRHPEAVSDGFFVAPGLRQDGQQVDLFAGDRPVTYDPPALVSATFQNRRWRHFYANLIVEWRRGSAQWRDILALRQSTIRWLCHDYAGRHPEAPLLRASLYFVEHSVDHPERGEQRRLIAQAVCGE